jgi:hypothetical protein
MERFCDAGYRRAARLARSTGWRLRRVGRRVRGWALPPELRLVKQGLLGGSHDSSSPRSRSDPRAPTVRCECVGAAPLSRGVFKAATPLRAIWDSPEWGKLTAVPRRQHRISRPHHGSSIREAVGMNPGRSASRSYDLLLLSCPRCGLSISPRVHWLAIEHCPRCLAHARVAVRLSSSPSVSENLYRQRPTLHADPPGSRAVDRSRPR